MLEPAEGIVRYQRNIAIIATITGEHKQAAKHQIIEHIKQGVSVQEARTAVAVPMHHATAYWLTQRVCTNSRMAFFYGRSGRFIKLRDEV